jgi:2-polyprenyl-3-methyl-5-hydroxy-6-metoxy-1,4-benzoquinol methylase
MTTAKSSTSLTAHWRAMVEAEHAQSDRVRGATPPPSDFWEGRAQFFTQDPRRANDRTIDRLAWEVAPDTTLLDVGAGAGRIALPLALRCKHVTAVEPSPAMVRGLTATAAEHHISNVTVVQQAWETAEVPPADVVLCSNVLYTVRDAAAFIRKLEQHAQQKVLIILHHRQPIHFAAPLWPAVHGEKRLRLPALPELLPLLWEMDIYPNLEMLPPSPPRSFATPDEAKQALLGPLFIQPGSEKERVLDRVLPSFLDKVDGGFVVRGSQPQRPGLVWWTTNVG